MDHIPVLAGSHGHTGDRKIFVQLVKGCGISAAAAADHSGADLHRLIGRAAEKEPVEEGYKRSVGGGIIDRRADHDAVAGIKLRRGFIDNIIKYAFFRSFCRRGRQYSREYSDFPHG